MTHKAINPENWASPKGYSNAMLTADGTLYIGGQVGWNAEEKFESDNFIGQMEQALRNIVTIIDTAGGKIEDITRLTWFVTDKQEYMKNQSEVGKVYRKVLGRHFPAMSMVIVAGLVEDGALLEIEATAVLTK